MKRVLVMCNNPTTDGPMEWEGHEMVAYVDITEPSRTQEEHKKRLNGLKAKYAEELAEAEEKLAEAEGDPSDEPEELYTIIAEKQHELAEIDELLKIPMPVEELSKVYYKGIDSVPKDLVVDVVLSMGCPLDTSHPSLFRPGSPDTDLLLAVQRHLRPGGELYMTGGNWNSYHETLRSKFEPLVTYDHDEPAKIGSAYYFARGADTEQPYSVLIRKAGGGRRRNRKTYRRRPNRKLTRKRK